MADVDSSLFCPSKVLPYLDARPFGVITRYGLLVEPWPATSLPVSTPFSQAKGGTVGKGRDHNMNGFSIWMAGGGLKKGLAYGATDDVGWKSVEQPVTWPDFHATVLHLLGIDHERLTYYHNGIQRRLTNVHGHVVKGLLT